MKNPVLKAAPELPVDIDRLLSPPLQPMWLKDKRRQQTLAVRCKYGDYVLADTEDGYGRLYRVDGIVSSLVARMEAVPITLRETSAYVDQHHRHNTGPKFHKFSICCVSLESRSQWASLLPALPRPVTNGRRNAGDQPLLYRPPLCGRV